MTDDQLKQALKPLEEKIKQYADSGQGSLSATDIALLKTLYPALNEKAQGLLPKQFNTGCSTCVKEVFTIYCSWYLSH